MNNVVKLHEDEIDFDVLSNFLEGFDASSDKVREDALTLALIECGFNIQNIVDKAAKYYITLTEGEPSVSLL